MALVNRNIVAVPHPSDPRQPVDAVGGRTKSIVIILTFALLLALAGAVGAAPQPMPDPIGPFDPETGRTVDRALPAMTHSATLAVVGGFFESLEAGSFSRYFAADAVLARSTCGEPAFGRADVAAAITGVCHDAFAGELTVNSMIVGAGWAAVDGTVYATQVEPFNGIVPSDRTLVIPYSAFYELAGGQIVTVKLNISMDALVQQITAPDAPSATPNRGEAY